MLTQSLDLGLVEGSVLLTHRLLLLLSHLLLWLLLGLLPLLLPLLLRRLLLLRRWRQGSLQLRRLRSLLLRSR